MKRSLLAAILILAVLPFVSASPIQTAIVKAGGPPLSITVPSGQVLVILNFVGEPGTNYPGIVSVTIGGQTANVMGSSTNLGQETRIPFNIAGPATLTVDPQVAGPVTISYTYDRVNAVDSKLANISTRGLVQTGDNVLIGGFIVLGPNALQVIVRAIGPSLPVAGRLADPTLDLYDGNGLLLASNDNWRDTQEAEIIATTIPPTDDAESAIVQTVAPGAYTAIVRGKNGTTGVALVEVYALEPTAKATSQVR